MSEIVKSRYQGILIPDERFNLDNLTDEDHATAPSNYDQAGPKPGVPEAEQSSRMVLQASGEQPERTDLGIHSVRAGHPGLERAGFLWYDASEDDPVEFGWDVPQLLTGWESRFWSTDATELSATPDLIRLQSGKLLATGLQDKTNYHQQIDSYNPDAATKWSTVGTLIPDNPTAQGGTALCQLPSGRVLLYLAQGAQVDCYFSDDDGANWEPYSYRVLDVPLDNAGIGMIRAAYSAGEVLLLIQYEDAGGTQTAAQYGSDDLGGRFTQVVANWATTITAEDVDMIDIVEADGAFVVCYNATNLANGYHRSRSIGSAFESVTDATAIDIEAGSVTGEPAISAWRDDDGVIYAAAKNEVFANIIDLKIYRSRDAGASWESLAADGAFHQMSDVRLVRFVVQSVAGQAVALTRWDGAGTLDGPQSLASIYLGGFSTHTGPAEQDATDFGDDDYVSFTRNTDLSLGGGSWLPIARPVDSTWTGAGTGGTDALTSGKLEITTAADTRYVYRDGGEDDSRRLFAEIGLEVSEGTGSLTVCQIGARFRLGDGVDAWEVTINVTSTGWALYDVAGAAQIGATVTEDMTKELHIRVALEQGTVRAWYARRSNVTYREWEEGPTGAVTPVASGNASRILWGHFKPGANTSRWSMVGYCFWPEFWTPVSNQYAGGWNTPGDLHPKSYSTMPSQIVDKTRIAAVAGPTRYDERWTVSTDYDYPIRQLLPSVAPSPRSTWRSTGGIENIIAWDIGGDLAEARLENSTIGIVLLGINFRTAALESWDGAAWQTVADIDAGVGLDSLRFESRGSAIFPETGGGAHKAARYLMMDDLVGGTFVDLTNTKHRKINRNTEGAWTDEAAKHPTVYLDGADGTEAGAGDCELWAPSCATIAHNFTAKHRYYRLRIPAQTTAEGYFEIGQVVIGAFAIFGTQYGRGRQIVSRNNTELISLPNGQTRARKRGPQSREVEFAWVDGVDASQINKVDPVPDYVARNIGGDPIASVRDSLYLMDSVIGRQGGALSPVVYFARIPTDSNEEQTNNPRHFVYGRITGSATRSNILGDEERTDLDRLNTITIAEIV